jgi:hypothetical protein
LPQRQQALESIQFTRIDKFFASSKRAEIREAFGLRRFPALSLYPASLANKSRSQLMGNHRSLKTIWSNCCAGRREKIRLNSL